MRAREGITGARAPEAGKSEEGRAPREMRAKKAGPLSPRALRRGTFWRVYLHGLLLLVLVAVAIVAVGRTVGRGPHPAAMERMTGWMARELEPLLDDPPAFGQMLAENASSLRTSFAAYRLDGTRLAAAGDDPPPMPRRIRRRGPRIDRKERLVVAPIGRPPQAILVGRIPRWSDDWTRPAAAIGAVLVALAIGSIPLARSIASPLERLTGAVRRFGAGDLAVRAGPRRAAGEVGELQRAFDEMAERIEALVRSEKELIANVSHELRTPLARIRVALELAGEGDAKNARWLQEIETDLAELDAMIDDVLTAARLDVAAGAGPGGTPPLRRTTFPARELVEAAAERFAALHPGRALQVEAPRELPRIEGDIALLRRALGNLLDNAAKYSEDGIDLLARVDGGKLVIEVVDRGIGVDPGDLPRLFTPFFRTDRSRSRGTGGIGLGLALARRIVEAHGGAIAAQSRPGVETRFRVELPA